MRGCVDDFYFEVEFRNWRLIMFSLMVRYKEETQSARDRLQAESLLFMTSAGVVEAALTGHGRTILISHGSGGGYDMGLWLAHLIGGQFQYIAPSRFGYLRSPLPPKPTPETQADTYAAILDTLKVNSAIIIGLSAGGASALQFALRHSGRCHGLVMLSAASRPVPPLPPILRAIYRFMLKSDFIPWLFYSTAPHAVFQANGVSRALLAQIKLEREKIRLLDALYQTTFPSTLRREGMLNDMEQLTTLPSYPIEHIAAPTLVVHAVNDPIIPFESGEFSANTIPNAQFLRLDDGGHFACVTHREETMPIVQEFLNRCGV
jgi:pimeloyl-ACP methyl ester carboxylesterase